jgi:hypothetical protein
MTDAGRFVSSSVLLTTVCDQTIIAAREIAATQRIGRELIAFPIGPLEASVEVMARRKIRRWAPATELAGVRISGLASSVPGAPCSLSLIAPGSLAHWPTARRAISLTNQVAVMERGTSAKTLSIEPLLAGGGRHSEVGNPLDARLHRAGLRSLATPRVK